MFDDGSMKTSNTSRASWLSDKMRKKFWRIEEGERKKEIEREKREQRKEEERKW